MTSQLSMFNEQPEPSPTIRQRQPGEIPDMPAGTVVKVRTPVTREVREGLVVRMDKTSASVEWRATDGWKRSIFHRSPYQILAAKLDGVWVEFA